LRKSTLLFLALLFIALMVACNGGAATSTSEPTNDSGPGPNTTLTTPAMATSTTEPSGYPPFPTSTLPGAGTGYPVATPLPTTDPYPGGLATIVHPMGLQCEEPAFPDLSAAIGSLEDAGIAVVAGEEIGLEVCEACGCATSTHFRVQINAADLDKALDLGWRRMVQ
jgi:hypothetical protein